MKYLLTVLIVAIFALASAEEKRFDNYHLIRVRFNTEENFQLFQKYFPSHKVDVWSYDGGYAKNLDMDILFTPKQVTKLARHYFNKDIEFDKFEVLSKNIQSSIDAEKEETAKIDEELNKKLSLLKTNEEKENLKYSEEEFYKKYHNLAEILAYLDKLNKDYKDMVDKKVIGKSVEGRDILMFKIHKPGKIDEKKPALFINSLQHAREWISPPTSLYSIYKILSTYETDAKVKHILKKINIYYVPLVNPDGYHYTHTNNRMWRKNRKPNGGSSFGVDLNRNWRSGFGGQGSSGVPSSETYRGTAALSEPETAAISKFLYGKPQIKAGLDFHAYSQLNLRPWGKVTGPSPDEAKLAKIGQDMCDAIKKVHNLAYRNIRSAQLYPASGILCDEFYEV